jgi:hypothetical protein
MSGILGKFQVEHDIRGARVIARTHQLTGDCVGEAEIELAIQMLKDDLDACGKEMKRVESRRYEVFGRLRLRL